MPKMSRQQMQFQLEYSAPGKNSNCKSCKDPIGDNELMIGVKSDSMYDPMWYHFNCFWTRCWYRKQIVHHLDNYKELAGFSFLSPQDKEIFKDAMVTNANDSDTPGLKRKSESDDTMTGLTHKRSRPEAVQLPRLPSSAAEFISKSSNNTDNKPTDAREEVALLEGKSVVVSRNSGELEILITSQGEAGGKSVTMTVQQWRKMTSCFGDVTGAVASVKEGGSQVIPVDAGLKVRVSQASSSQYSIVLAVTKETNGANLNEVAKDITLTFTADQWSNFKTCSAQVETVISRLSC